MSADGLRYRVEYRWQIEITAEAFIEAFPEEWDDAQRRGLDEDGFARESIHECDLDTLADLGEDVIDDWDVVRL